MTDDASSPQGRAARCADRLRVVAIIAFLGISACTPRSAYPASPVEGIVVSVDSAGLGQVRGFDLRSHARTLHFQIGSLENPTEFAPGHLAEHQASSSPVRVYFRLEGGGGTAIVYRLEDAEVPVSSG